MFRLGVRAPIAAAAMALAGVALTAQSPGNPQRAQTPTFRSATDVVRLDVSVFDLERQPVRGLTPQDFTVFENGVRQDIVVFEPVELPDEVRTEAVWASEATPDVADNTPAEARLWVLMLDDGTIRTDPWSLAAVKQIARRVVEQIHPDDRMTVVFSRNNLNAQDFTSVRARLFSQIDTFDIGFMGMHSSSDLYATSSSLRTLEAAVRYLTDLPDRRRVLVYIGAGMPVQIAVAPSELTFWGVGGKPAWNRDYQLSIGQYARDLLEEARLAGISVYTFSACGLGDSRCTSSLAVEFLRVLAAETGGRVTASTNDFEPGIRQMFVENQSYYLMGYRTSTPQTTAYRRIEVKVNRPDVEVRTRTGYFVESERERVRAAEARAKLAPPVAALTGILPQSDLPLRLTAAPFARRGSREAQVAVVLGADLPGAVVPRTGRAVETLSVETRAFTPEGHARGEWRQQVDVTLRPPARGAEPSAEVLTRLELRPGRYTLRVGAHGRTIDTAGSVYADVEIPDFANAPVSLSGAVLSVEPREVQAGERSVSGWLPVVPTALRTFTPRHLVTSFLRVYQGGRAPLEPVTLTRRLVDGTGGTVLEETETLAPARFGSARAADVLWRVPTTDLAPGPYLLRITATLGADVVTSDVVFRRE